MTEGEAIRKVICVSKCKKSDGAPRSAYLALIALLALDSCTSRGAPTYPIVGAFFPGWMFCAVIGIGAALAARGLFVASGLNRVLPFQLFVCTSVGVIIAALAWILWFGQ